MNKNEHSIVDFWHVGIQYSRKNTQYYYGKGIYKPNNGLYGVDLHWANRVESDNYEQIRVPMEDLYIIHARDYSVCFKNFILEIFILARVLPHEGEKETDFRET